MAPTALPLIGFGQVRHTRLRPVHHAFAYHGYFLLLPLRSMSRSPASPLPVNRPGLLSFSEQDHGDGRAPADGGALGWLNELLMREGVEDADGEIWLQCYPRVMGHTFKPVSFWYCHRADGGLRAIVVEVNNTFGERHCYLLDEPAWGRELTAAKVFHVSPFCKVEGGYRFRFMRTGEAGAERIVARIDHDDSEGPLIRTSVCGTLEPVSHEALRRAFWRFPALTLGVVARIHWQALKLWLKRVRFHTKPPVPDTFVTR
jgi:uncharacterized protein